MHIHMSIFHGSPEGQYDFQLSSLNVQESDIQTFGFESREWDRHSGLRYNNNNNVNYSYADTCIPPEDNHIRMSKPPKYANKIRMGLAPGINVGTIIKQTISYNLT